MKKTRLKSPAINAPASQRDAEQLLDEIGVLQERVDVIEADMNAELRTVKDAHEVRAQPLNAEIEQKFAELQTWAESHRADLTQNGKRKSANISTGEIGWRKNPPSVRITKPVDVIERLNHAKLTQFLRVKIEIDKEAVLADKDTATAIAGIKVDQKELFFATPYRSQIERSVAIKTGAKK